MAYRRLRLRAGAWPLAAGSLVLAPLVGPATPGMAAAITANTTLHVLSDIGTVDLDPSAVNTLATRSLSWTSGLVIRSLTRLVYDPKSSEMVLRPDLATTLGTHNATYTSWTFTLRRDVRFDNGKLVRPMDVKYGIERSFDSATFPHGPRYDVPQSVAVKNVLVQALDAAGFKPEPYATTKARYVHEILKNPDAPVNVRAVTTCSPFPTGGSVLVPEFRTTDLRTTGFRDNYTAFSNKAVDNRTTHIERLPSNQQPAAWSRLDKFIQTKFFPTAVTTYHGVALMRGSRVQGLVLSTVLGMPAWDTLTLRP